MKMWAKLLVLPVLCGVMAPGRDATNTAAPKWRIDLKEKYQFEAFDRAVTFRWTLHQDVLFLSPDKLLVYQVGRSRTPARLVPRESCMVGFPVLSSENGR